MSEHYTKVDAIASTTTSSSSAPQPDSKAPEAAGTGIGPWTNTPATPIKRTIIVGAGPSGLVLGILLARAGIPVTLLEASHKLDENPRAAHYAPSACYDLDRAGVLGDIAERGFFPDSVCWRKPDGSYIGGIRNEGVEVDFPMVCLPLDRLDKLLLEHFERYENTEMLFEHKVVGVRQEEGEAKVEVEVKGGERVWMGADFVVGADGANSQIRRSLFGDFNYPGETLQKQIIATNVKYDFKKFGYWDSNFIIDPEDWYMAAKITKDGLWRVTYGDEWGLSNDEYLKRQPMRFEKILPGNPKPGDYELVSASPYKLHQRCSPSMREGRFLLVADAGHLCNPFGGLGLTGGFADVGSLFDALNAIHTGRVKDTSILDEYSRLRIKKWQEVINPMSRKNFGLIWDPSMEKDRDEFFAFTKTMESNKELAQTMARSTHGLRENLESFITQASLGPVPKTGQEAPSQPKGLGAFNILVEEKVA